MAERSTGQVKLYAADFSSAADLLQSSARNADPAALTPEALYADGAVPAELAPAAKELVMDSASVQGAHALAVPPSRSPGTPERRCGSSPPVPNQASLSCRCRLQPPGCTHVFSSRSLHETPATAAAASLLINPSPRPRGRRRIYNEALLPPAPSINRMLCAALRPTTAHANAASNSPVAGGPPIVAAAALSGAACMQAGRSAGLAPSRRAWLW